MLLQEELNKGRRTLVDVEIISASIVSNVLSMIFVTILKEECIMSCTTQETTTLLDNDVNDTLTSSIADGKFAETLKNEYEDAVSGSSTIDASDTLFLSFCELNTTAGAATIDVTIYITVTTSSPTSQPTNIPTESPSAKLRTTTTTSPLTTPAHYSVASN